MHPELLPVIAVAVLSLACAPTDTSADTTDDQVWVPVVSAFAWTELSFEDDPFADQRPAEATCDPVGHGTEEFGGEPSYVIDTGLCDYLTISQAALQTLPAATPIRFKVWHFDLEADLDMPESAYIVLEIDGQLVWDHSTPLPATAELLTGEFDMPTSVELGARRAGTIALRQNYFTSTRARTRARSDRPLRRSWRA